MSARKSEARTQGARERATAKRLARQQREVTRLTTVHAKRVEKAREAKRKLDEAKAASKPTKKGTSK